MSPKFRRMERELLEQTLRRGRVAHSRSFSLRYLPLSSLAQSSGAVVVSKKVSPTAVARNSLKRRGRELLRLAVGELREPYALVLVFQKGASERPFAQLRDELIKKVPLGRMSQ